MGGTGLGICLCLSMAAPPVPAAPTPRLAQPDPDRERDAKQIAAWLTDLAYQVSSSHSRNVPPHKLVEDGLAELSEKAGRKLPDDLKKSLATAQSAGQLVKVVANAILVLGPIEGMTASKQFVIAANGFARATDPYSGLIWHSGDSIATSDSEFGLGFELEGATGPEWIAYILESTRTGTKPVRPPTTAPWLVRRVIPGSPAAKAGLRPDDLITHLDGEAITSESNPTLFRQLAAVGIPFLRDPNATVDVSRPVVVRVKRANAEQPIEMKLSRAGYEPETVFGVTRRDDGSWDWMLDREAKIGYIRLGAVERDRVGVSTSVAFERALADLEREGAQALILDLRWSPGGYVLQITQIVGALLPPGKTVATLQGPARNQASPRGYYTSLPPGAGTWRRFPLAVLVNGETTGGGEMIAAAFQDHGRAVVIGQRTFGKANLMDLSDTTTLPGGFGYRVTTGITLRPNGKDRHRQPDSKPTDEWGVRPDKGYEVPMTADLSARLKQEAERHAIRPAGSTEIVAYDDPLTDPQRIIALKLFKEKLKDAERAKDLPAK